MKNKIKSIAIIFIVTMLCLTSGVTSYRKTSIIKNVTKLTITQVAPKKRLT